MCNELTGRNDEIRDNYENDFNGELTGVEATLYVEKRFRHTVPCPMLQLTVFRREYLVEHDLKCIYGLRMQDSEFSPRALYFAQRIVPLHEQFYLYRIRENSVQTIRIKSLMAFHAKVSKEPNFDHRVAEAWAHRWCFTIFNRWFAKAPLKDISLERRLETLGIIFADGFDDFHTLLKSASFGSRIAGKWVETYMRSPSSRGRIEKLFLFLFPLLKRF